MRGITTENFVSLLLSVTVPIAQSAMRIALIILAGYIAVRFVRAALSRLEALLIKAGEGTEPVPGTARKRVTTLVGLLRTLTQVIIWAVAAIMCLGQLGLDITPILAGAGIAGLAVGFGAQNLVRDVISGFFMVLENQVRVGDVAVVNGTGGLVEAITFRTIVLRNLAGVVHVFPHGSVTTLANMTKGWSAYVIDVDVAYKEDTDHIVDIMRRVAEELRRDSSFGSAILQPIEIFGVDNFRESAVSIKARLKTLPLQQWDVGREYRRRLKKAFEAEKIEAPVPRQSIYMEETGKPLQILLKDAAPTPGAQRS
jgi:small conductance mechanosensitive channel